MATLTWRRFGKTDVMRARITSRAFACIGLRLFLILVLLAAQAYNGWFF